MSFPPSSSPRTLSASQRLDWLRLIRSENVGPITFQRLLERFGSAEAALAALPELSRRGGRAKPVQICPKAAAERETEAIAKLGATLIAVGEPDYPPLLAQIEDAPPLLVALGNTHLLRGGIVAMVGARNASIGGQRLARQLAMGIGQAGRLTVVSGLARGIDTAAHEGALETGTIAVMAGGVDVVYPAENARLHAQIAQRGILISEMPPGTVPQARHFPRRNRLVSGVALGVVVVEASPRSGSLITARLAGEQGREVFAVPGSPLDPRSRGTNQLLRDGATLVETEQDVLRVLDDLLRRPLAEPRSSEFGQAPSADPTQGELEAARRQILDGLGAAPVTVDEIIRRCQLSPGVVSVVLLELEMAGRLERYPGNRVSLLGIF